jgi:hypothetical protein
MPASAGAALTPLDGSDLSTPSSGFLGLSVSAWVFIALGVVVLGGAVWLVVRRRT